MRTLCTILIVCKSYSEYSWKKSFKSITSRKIDKLLYMLYSNSINYETVTLVKKGSEKMMRRMPFEPPTDFYNEKLRTVDEQIVELIYLISPPLPGDLSGLSFHFKGEIMEEGKDSKQVEVTLQIN